MKILLLVPDPTVKRLALVLLALFPFALPAAADKASHAKPTAPVVARAASVPGTVAPLDAEAPRKVRVVLASPYVNVATTN